MLNNKNVTSLIIAAAVSIITISGISLILQNALPVIDPSLKNYYNNKPATTQIPDTKTTSEIISEESADAKTPVDTIVIRTKVEPTKINTDEYSTVSKPENITENSYQSPTNETTDTKSEDVIIDTSTTTLEPSVDNTKTENVIQSSANDNYNITTVATAEPSAAENNITEKPESTAVIKKINTPETTSTSTETITDSIIADMTINDDIDKAYAALYSYDYELNNNIIIDELTDIGNEYGMSINKDLHASCFHDGSIHPYNIEDANTYTAAVTYKTNPTDIKNDAIKAFSEINKTYGDMCSLDFNVEIIDYIDLTMPAPSKNIRNCYAIIILYK